MEFAPCWFIVRSMAASTTFMFAHKFVHESCAAAVTGPCALIAGTSAARNLPRIHHWGRTRWSHRRRLALQLAPSRSIRSLGAAPTHYGRLNEVAADAPSPGGQARTESARGFIKEGPANSCRQAPWAPADDTYLYAGAATAIGRPSHADPAVPAIAPVPTAPSTIAHDR